jgi:twitching motility protein PilU
MEFWDWFVLLAHGDSSDLLLTAGASPAGKFQGKMMPLCLSTLHANNSNQALGRIINFFPEECRNQRLLDLSLNLRAFVPQRLIPARDGKREVMEKSEELGMQTFDVDLLHLYKKNKITLEEALRNADSPNTLKLRVSLSETNATETKDGEPKNPSLQGKKVDEFSLTQITQENENK